MMGYLKVKDPNKQYPDYKAAKVSKMTPEELQKSMTKLLQQIKQLTM